MPCFVQDHQWQAENLYNGLNSDGAEPNAQTFAGMLWLYSKLNSPKYIKKILKHMDKKAWWFVLCTDVYVNDGIFRVLKLSIYSFKLALHLNRWNPSIELVLLFSFYTCEFVHFIGIDRSFGQRVYTCEATTSEPFYLFPTSERFVWKTNEIWCWWGNMYIII